MRVDDDIDHLVLWVKFIEQAVQFEILKRHVNVIGPSIGHDDLVEILFDIPKFPDLNGFIEFPDFAAPVFGNIGIIHKIGCMLFYHHRMDLERGTPTVTRKRHLVMLIIFIS
ncbi:hypothetical protein DESC_40061 [Desulfosarcina cetonica]|uniref:hypothetical protein n=1 Tax=Desulfosarcina cetonica TaxID=90730 RepID=UPI00155DBC34|nr:hypothetical protein [Desulfosarcina cetonica]VTR66030.1 hypothetical protein DESC_40061 [Desulfosarcina cetonica]